MGAWLDISTARAEWWDAPDDDTTLARLLEVAKTQVIAFAPTLDDITRPTESYVLAQLMQARNLWNTGRIAPDSTAAVDGFVIQPHPLDWQIKQLLRPRNPRPTAT